MIVADGPDEFQWRPPALTTMVYSPYGTPSFQLEYETVKVLLPTRTQLLNAANKLASYQPGSYLKARREGHCSPLISFAVVSSYLNLS